MSTRMRTSIARASEAPIGPATSALDYHTHNRLLRLDGLANRYFGLRHGQSSANLAGLIVSDPMRGTVGHGLTPAGRAQVEASISASNRLGSATLFLSSDFLRARETCYPALPESGGTDRSAACPL